MIPYCLPVANILVPSFMCIFSSGFSRRTPSQQLDSGLYLSSFHDIPKRRKFTKQGWEKFTRDSTEAALEELVSSPGFGKWLHQNADRITVTPNSGKSDRKQGRSLVWFLSSCF